jgi:hypothetical protein
MAGYYDRLEDQLARATTRGAPRRRLAALPKRPHPRWEWLAAAAAVAVCVAVSLALILGARSANHNRQATVHHHAHHQLPEIHNYAPGPVPPLGGQMVCDVTLKPPRGAGSATATITVHTGRGASEVYSLKARSLKPAPAGKSYEVWTIPETQLAFGGYQLQNGARPSLLGVIKPPVTADGVIAASGTFPPGFNGGAYRFLITVQRPGAKSPGRVVLRGDIPL